MEPLHSHLYTCLHIVQQCNVFFSVLLMMKLMFLYFINFTRVLCIIIDVSLILFPCCLFGSRYFLCRERNKVVCGSFMVAELGF